MFWNEFCTYYHKIYKDRETQKALAPKTINEAVALMLPAYVIHCAISNLHKGGDIAVRQDVHVSAVTTIAKIASLVKNELWREQIATRCEQYYQIIRHAAFYNDGKEFLYASAAAVVKMVDDFRYPPDAPIAMACVLISEDAQMDEVGDWNMNEAHAVQVTGKTYDAFVDTGLYKIPDGG